MKTKILFIFLWLLLPQTIMSQVNMVVVNMKDGSTMLFRLTEGPVITYSNNCLVIKTTTKEASLPVTNIKDVTLEGRSVATVIDQTAITDCHILFHQLLSGSDVCVFTMDGKSVHIQKADNNGNADLDLSRLPHGVLVIQTSSGTIKVNN